MAVLANIVAPIFALVLCGYLAGRTGALGDASAGALNRFVYFFALPALLFLFTARAPVADLLNWPFIGAFLLGSALTFVAAMALARCVLGLGQPEFSLFALAAVFPNTAYLGIPLFITAFGEQSAGPAIVATVTANTVFIAGTIALLESGRPKTDGIRQIGQIGRKLLLNPLVVAPILALPFAFWQVGLPEPVVRFLDLLGSTAGPAALFALGLSFVERQVRAPAGELGAILAMKLAVHPLLVGLFAYYVFAVDPFWAKAAVLLAAMPTGALAFVLAQERGAYSAEVSAVTVISTAVSIVSIGALLVALH